MSVLGVEAVPPAPGALPFLGHAVALARDPFTFLSSLPAYGDLVRIRLGPQTVIMTCDPGLTRAMLVDDRTFDKGGPFYDRAREASGDGLVTCPHQLHRRQRRLCQPAFHPAHFPAYTTAMVTTALSMARSWRHGQVIDVNHAMVTMTMRAMVKAMFATRLSAATDRQVVDDLTVATAGIFRRMLTPPRLTRVPTPGNLRYNRAQARLRRTIADAVSDRRTDRAADQGGLLSVLLSAEDPDSTGDLRALSDTEVAEQVLTFFLAGAETTANLLAWTLYELGRAPGLQERLHAHTASVLRGRSPSFELLPELTFADHVATEALRMYPSAWFLTRTAAHDTRLGEVSLPAGTTLAYSAYLIQRRPDLYPDPDRFDPDRWEGHKPGRTAYIPFGAGARKCIGDRFAHSQAILSLAAMTSMWRFVPLTDRVPRPAVHATLMPRGLRMRVMAHPRL
ncbi:cytochrome P450 [Actinomadura rubrisoli]|uniref:Cytochrome P450 n=1 Tax=Actinomadura rubrisoli TaxID=2530368 RepID=A0A4R5B8R5_9ACTN|nr:cytochrome P450 [Actinomadura rubrisoli]TDD80916.1 cytochrome P450 [Actinomadura rubrisoli]